MSVPTCEVIGCERPAEYMRVQDGATVMEDYLCRECYQKCRLRFYRKGLYYLPLSLTTRIVTDTPAVYKE